MLSALLSVHLGPGSPVSASGYGIGYIIKDNGIQFCVCSKHRQTARFEFGCFAAWGRYVPERLFFEFPHSLWCARALQIRYILTLSKFLCSMKQLLHEEERVAIRKHAEASAHSPTNARQEAVAVAGADGDEAKTSSPSSPMSKARAANRVRLRHLASVGSTIDVNVRPRAASRDTNSSSAGDAAIRRTTSAWSSRDVIVPTNVAAVQMEDQETLFGY